MFRDKIGNDVLDRRPTTLRQDGEAGPRDSELDDSPAVRRKCGSGRGEADDPRRARIGSSKHLGEVPLDLRIASVIDGDNGRWGEARQPPCRPDDLRGAMTARPVLRHFANPLHRFQLEEVSWMTLRRGL
jgi:hypothetical protein